MIFYLYFSNEDRQLLNYRMDDQTINPYSLFFKNILVLIRYFA